MKPFRLTTILCAFAVFLIAGTAIGFPIAVERGAPYRITTSECLICGRMQTVERRWRRAPKETIEAHKDSLWMQPQIDKEHDHWWIRGSTEERPSWFAGAYIGCGGGIGGVSRLHYLATKRGAGVAESFVLKYKQLLIDGDLKSIREFVENEVQAALTNPPKQTAAAW
ncbi:MAG: hypothetical protein ACKVHE_03330 [Planctomycetales bacterium]|jgi:hypothetical protein